jgi:outer membrane protein insertion porin family
MPFRYSARLILLLVSVSLWAQTSATAPRAIAAYSTKISGIHVTGSTRYSSEELASATGLKLGAEGADAALKAGAELLASSGMFTDVTYSYVSSPQGTEVKYVVQDTGVLYPVRFDNFVWMQRDELVRALEQKHPLFRGELPGAGEMYSQLAADMEAMLAERHIAATVQARPMVSQNGGAITAFIYHVAGVRIPVRTVDFPGASAEMERLLKQTAAGKINAEDYTESGLSAFSRLDLLPLYLTRGYLRARFHSPEFTLADAASNSVAVRLAVEEGLCYRLAEVQWSGNTVFSSQDLTRNLKVETGKAANQPLLEAQLGGLSKVYGTKGYMSARLKPVPILDDIARTVTFRVEVNEGDEYHFGSVRLEGASEPINKKFAELWKLRPGDVYDSSQPTLVLQGLATFFNFNGIRIGVDQSSKQESKTVDLVIRFTVRQPQ